MQGSSEPSKRKKERKEKKKCKSEFKHEMKNQQKKLGIASRNVIVCTCYLIRNFYPIARGDPKGSFMAIEKPCKRPGPGATATALRRLISSIHSCYTVNNGA